jgi:hypothetical protein
VIGDNEKIGGAKIDQRTDIKAKAEIGNDAYKVRNENQQDELIKSNRLLSLGRGVIFPDPRIDNILIEGPE